jgi:hypothetical protein
MSCEAFSKRNVRMLTQFFIYGTEKRNKPEISFWELAGSDSRPAPAQLLRCTPYNQVICRRQLIKINKTLLGEPIVFLVLFLTY